MLLSMFDFDSPCEHWLKLSKPAMGLVSSVSDFSFRFIKYKNFSFGESDIESDIQISNQSCPSMQAVNKNVSWKLQYASSNQEYL